MSKELPDKLSELILLALKDFSKAMERGLKEDMTAWVSKRWTGCYVCLGGAIMVGTLDLHFIHDRWLPMDCGSQEITDKLYAIDYVRRGLLYQALAVLKQVGFDCDNQDQVIAIEVARATILAQWNSDKERANFSAYRETAQFLQEVGL